MLFAPDDTMAQRETFILRLLRIRQDREWHVLFSLRNIKTDESQTFSSADELAAFLKSGAGGKKNSDELDE